ncbi:MAG TPA: PP2C family protein-serine/threonine phosphatase [Thermoanaerobaculales bacterium]|nr:PP2C family protein-serine/threonine phosphatase [Thermoanaerobaculales bacterium]HQL30301.1 PP2C family protein-serine/threonine phosphatase [Thermoanaerobaculales bacterium]HQN95252.1 PP2C family protein-serine/threonine phosphatase [Thermoanaerobaculales bacterium]HQP42492.1 PP2C family protein-serine/threonine phosphatase [Thermoanaerobaculales bacterium]
MTVATEVEQGRLALLEQELANFRALMAHVHSTPAELSLRNIDIHGATFPLNGELGGDHIIFVDFARRYDLDHLIEDAERSGARDRAARLKEGRRKIGVLLADASGHSTTDAVLTAMLHQAFLTGVLYELEMNGHVSAKLFEILNTRFHQSSSVTKFVTMIYGEIAESGTFRFVSAGHPPPMVFSAEFDCFVRIDPDRLRTFFPVGMFPTEAGVEERLPSRPLAYKKKYTVNEVNLMAPGDILFLFTDGLADHACDGQGYLPGRLESVVRTSKHLPAREIVAVVRADMERFAPPADDTSLVVIKRMR